MTAASGAVEVSVIVCTRNRPDDLVGCVTSILANRAPAFELIVIDQGDDARAYERLGKALDDTRLRYIRSEQRGLSNARNEGLSCANGEVVAFTDDDCRVPADWVACVVAFFGAYPEAALVFGRVTVPPEFGEEGFAASFEPDECFLRGTYPAPLQHYGVGANMALRAHICSEIGRFDPLLGAGARFPAGEEADFQLRALGAGMTVAYTRTFEVLHLGVRRGEAAARLFKGYGIGNGAAFVKNIRLGTRGALKYVSKRVAMQVYGAASNALAGRRPLGLAHLVHTLMGAAWGSVQPIDQRLRCYVLQQPNPAPRSKRGAAPKY
jgi:glycosyltransferase involved in cell wall biosynthesis